MARRLILALSCLPLLVACQALAPSPTPIPTAPPTPTAPAATTELPTAVPLDPTTAPPTPTPTVPPTPSWTAYAADLRWPDPADLESLTEYDVTLTVEDFAAGLLTGRAHIRYTNAAGTSLPDLLFRLYPNTPGYDGALVINALYVNEAAVEPSYELEGTAARVPLPSPLLPGETTEVSVDYHLLVPQTNRQGYGALNREEGVMTLGGFYPAVAVYEGDHWQADLVPGVGDPAYAEAALFAVTVTAPPEMLALSSGRVVSEGTPIGDARSWTLVGGPVRDFALVLGDGYVATSEVVGDVLVRFSYRTPYGEAAAQQVVQIAADALRAYERLFGPYPYTELDLIEAPVSASGLEYPGSILLGAGAFTQGDEWLELVVAHEVAHQWWYGQVGNDQVNAAWLDEGLASYASVLYFREVHGADRAEAFMSSYYQQPYWAQPVALQRTPANLPVTQYTADNYGAVVYLHSTNFFYELHQLLGEDAFLALLQQFLTDFQYGIASGEDLVALARAIDPQGVDALYARWILGWP